MPRVSREQELKEKRPKRVPVAEANRNKLYVNGLDEENFVYRWVNDKEGRLEAFLAGYWEFVDQTGNPVGDGGVENSAGTSSKFVKGVGQGTKAYLMRIPKEFWDEDQARKEDDLKEREQAMKQVARNAADYGKLEIK